MTITSGTQIFTGIVNGTTTVLYGLNAQISDNLVAFLPVILPITVVVTVLFFAIHWVYGLIKGRRR